MPVSTWFIVVLASGVLGGTDLSRWATNLVYKAAIPHDASTRLSVNLNSNAFPNGMTRTGYSQMTLEPLKLAS